MFLRSVSVTSSAVCLLPHDCSESRTVADLEKDGTDDAAESLYEEGIRTGEGAGSCAENTRLLRKLYLVSALLDLSGYVIRTIGYSCLPPVT